ncbi:diguanylate cyclase domain-containing protein [Desulfocurvus sp. DL9XJH121]
MNHEPKRILIVDDSPANIARLSQALADEFEVRTVDDGEQALRLLNVQEDSERPDLVLLNVVLPGMDGYEACRRIKDDPATSAIPVILVSDKRDEEEETRGLEIGAVDYITKPFSLPIVRARVRTHVELKRQRDILSELSSVDGLTGIANRRRFDEFYDLEWLRSKRRQTPLSLIMADIDHFKAYNDAYGHAQGDECLKAVAGAMSDCLKRPTDLVARYGGEEFVVVLPETGPEGAGHLAEDMRVSVQNLRIPHADSAVAGHVTISLGTGTMVPDPDHEPEALVKLADDMLYKAKNNGRNQVQVG